MTVKQLVARIDSPDLRNMEVVITNDNIMYNIEDHNNVVINWEAKRIEISI